MFLRALSCKCKCPHLFAVLLLWEHKTICDNQYQELPFGSFLKACREEHKKISRKSRERACSYSHTLSTVPYIPAFKELSNTYSIELLKIDRRNFKCQNGEFLTLYRQNWGKYGADCGLWTIKGLCPKKF